MPNPKRYIISLGGSLIVPDEIDVKFIKGLRTLLQSEAKRGDSFVVVPGGGRTARKYGRALQELGNHNFTDLDWVGIYSIRLNQLFLSLVFKGDKGITILNAPKAIPGQSSDCHAVEYAHTHQAQTIINLSDVDYVYDKNPKTNKHAKPLTNISWEDFRQIVGSKWGPNQSWPFDPVASKRAQALKLKVIFLNGHNLKNLKNFLTGKKFNGTVIS